MLTSVRIKAWLSPLVTVLFAAMAVTGIMMLLHLPGAQPLHEVAGVAFAVAGVVHIASNWKALRSHFGTPRGRMALVAAALACVALLLAGIIGGGDHEAGRGRRDRARHEQSF